MVVINLALHVMDYLHKTVRPVTPHQMQDFHYLKELVFAHQALILMPK